MGANAAVNYLHTYYDADADQPERGRDKSVSGCTGSQDETDALILSVDCLAEWNSPSVGQWLEAVQYRRPRSELSDWRKALSSAAVTDLGQGAEAIGELVHDIHFVSGLASKGYTDALSQDWSRARRLARSTEHTLCTMVWSVGAWDQHLLKPSSWTGQWVHFGLDEERLKDQQIASAVRQLCVHANAPDEVVEYAKAYPDVLALLEQLWRRLLERLPITTTYELEVYSDPEFDDKHLLMTVSAGDEWDDTIAAIDDVVESLSEEYANCSGYVAVMPVSEGRRS